MYSTRFFSATKDYSSFGHHVPAPYMRRTVTLEQKPDCASILLCGLGFYKLYINGQDITNGYLTPYLSNPDERLYYDRYDLTPYLNQGKNVIGLCLGNGMLNCPGGQIWDFEKARFRSAPKVAFYCDIRMGNQTLVFEADEQIKCAPSPIQFDDLRCGERYDAGKEIPGWNTIEFDDSTWSSAIPAETPRGECVESCAHRIVKGREISPISVRPGALGHLPTIHPVLTEMLPEGEEAALEGYIYDFGVNAAGICRLRIHGQKGQKIILQFCETMHADGTLDMRPMNFLPLRYEHRIVFTCSGGEDVYEPSFCYFGYRYILAIGLTEEQATKDLLTYLDLRSDLPQNGDFHCSNELLNRLVTATKVSDLANFYYFPTDCPHREKNGWTGDAVCSAEQHMTFFDPTEDYREWLRNIRGAMLECGALPGIVPTTGWGFGACGTAWDAVIVYLPFYVWKYKGDLSLAEENATAIFRYLRYMRTQIRPDGLLFYGNLGDWCQSGMRDAGKSNTPQLLANTLFGMDICEKAEKLFRVMHLEPEAEYAAYTLRQIRHSARERLLNPLTGTTIDASQSGQALAIYYHLFDESERTIAVQKLVEMIHADGDSMKVGFASGRVLFRVLSDAGYTDLAYHLVTKPEYPSYAYWMETLDGTSMFEDFIPLDEKPNSRNHHAWGDIAAWFMYALTGIQVNPHDADVRELLIAPNFPAELSSAEGFIQLPCGQVAVSWTREENQISLKVQVPAETYGFIRLPKGWMFEDTQTVLPLHSNTFILHPQGEKTPYQY